MDKTDDKREIRHRMLALLGAHPSREADSAAIAKLIFESPAYTAARTLASFKALGDEVQVGLLDPRARADGKTLVFPRVVRRSRTLEFASGDEGFRRGHLGILEPQGQTVPLATIDLFLVPGLAFDRTGARLGRGQGYYDATLRAAPRGVRVGVGFSFQVVDRLPVTPEDERMDSIVVPGEVFAFEPRTA